MEKRQLQKSIPGISADLASGKSVKKNRKRKRKPAAKKWVSGEMYPKVMSCPRTLWIPGLDHDYEPGKGWVRNIH